MTRLRRTSSRCRVRARRRERCPSRFGRRPAAACLPVAGWPERSAETRPLPDDPRRLAIIRPDMSLSNVACHVATMPLRAGGARGWPRTGMDPLFALAEGRRRYRNIHRTELYHSRIWRSCSVCLASADVKPRTGSQLKRHPVASGFQMIGFVNDYGCRPSQLARSWPIAIFHVRYRAADPGAGQDRTVRSDRHVDARSIEMKHAARRTSTTSGRK